MALFPVLQNETIVQVGDKTRLDARKSFANGGDSITLLEIDAGDGAGFIDVTATKYLDTSYSTDADKIIEVRLNSTEVGTFGIHVITEEDDNLFSEDYDLELHEPDILRYVRDGRNTYKDIHRRVQTLLIDWLDENRFWKNNQDRYTKDDLVDIQDFKESSIYWVLNLIFEGLSDKVDDKWSQKALMYKGKAFEARSRGTLRLDANGDGTIIGEKVDNWSKRLTRI